MTREELEEAVKCIMLLRYPLDVAVEKIMKAVDAFNNGKVNGNTPLHYMAVRDSEMDR
jgi:hypothetical protein